MKMRMIKSPEEIELIKQGARIADLGGEAVVKAIKEGAAEHEIALASTNAMVKEIADTYPHSEIRDSKFQLFILLNSFIHFLFASWESSIIRKNANRMVAFPPPPRVKFLDLSRVPRRYQ